LPARSLGINPFDEPNVTESKDNTKRVLDQFQHDHKLPTQESLVTENGLTLSGDAPLRLTGAHGGLSDELRRHLARARSRGYFALLAYIAPSTDREQQLRELATLLRNRSGRAVTVGFGPRFLHSTGQLHKGGPPVGVFLQIVQEDGTDVPIPGQPYGFSILKQAQAIGDLQSLKSRRLPVLRVTLGRNHSKGWAALVAAVESAAGKH